LLIDTAYQNRCRNKNRLLQSIPIGKTDAPAS